MDAMYANQITITIGENETILHFAFLTPQYDEKGNLLEKPAIATEKNIVLSPEGYRKLKEMMNSVDVQVKE